MGYPNGYRRSYTPFYKQTTHFYKPTAHFHSFKCSKFKREKNEIKMIKRDWKLPNLSYFTYTSIVQPVLQANNPFYKPTAHFHSFCFKTGKFEAGKAASKWYKMARSHPTGHLKAPQCFNGVSQWLKYSYTPFLQGNTPFSQF